MKVKSVWEEEKTMWDENLILRVRKKRQIHMGKEKKRQKNKYKQIFPLSVTLAVSRFATQVIKYQHI